MWVHPPLDQTLGSHWAAGYGRCSLRSRDMGGANIHIFLISSILINHRNTQHINNPPFTALQLLIETINKAYHANHHNAFKHFCFNNPYFYSYSNVAY